MQGSFSEIAFDIVGAGGCKIQVLVNAVASEEAAPGSSFMRFAIFKAAERRAYEKGLLEARNRAEAAVHTERHDSELREQFIAVLGHDLRNPLASIASSIQMLGKEELSPRGQKVVGLMEASVVRAAALIDNVLDFARGRLGGASLRYCRTDRLRSDAYRAVALEPSRQCAYAWRRRRTDAD